MLLDHLQQAKMVKIAQRRELAELWGLETRNKYEIKDEQDNLIGFAAEQGKGAFAFLARYFLGHWRRFEIYVYNAQHQQVVTATHPFRFFFQRLDIYDANHTLIGAVQQRWSLLHKKFDIEDERGNCHMEVRSPLWKFWTFPVTRNGSEVGVIRKKWSGAITELFLDKDNFAVEFSTGLNIKERTLLLVAGLFVDLQYFEKRAKS